MSQSEKPINKLNVLINGKEYTLVSEKPKEHIQRVALYADSRSREISERPTSKTYTTSMLAVITSLNIAEDYIDLEDAYEEVKKKYENIKTEMFRQGNKVSSAEKELANIKRENSELKKKIDKMDAFMKAKGIKYSDK